MDFCGSCGRPASAGHEPGCAYAAPDAVTMARPVQAPAPVAGAGPVTGGPSGQPSSGVPTWALVAGGVSLAVLAAVGVLWLRGSSGSTSAGAAPSAVRATATPVVTATATVVVPASPIATSAPPASTAVRSLPSGSWITVLESLPKGEKSEGQAQAVADSLSTPTAKVVVVDSSAVPGLNPGYWAVSMVGHSSSAQARAACGLVGRDLGGSCYDRQVK